jgi:hypothetical protein
MKYSLVLRILLLITLMVSYNSCLTTLYPFFTEKDVTFNSELIGNWVYSRGTERGSISFETIPQGRLSELAPGIRKLSAKGYFVTWKDSTGRPTSKYFVFQAMIGNSFYIDHYPAEMDFEQSVAKVFKEHHIKMHSCYKLNIRGKNLFEMKLLERSFLDDLIERKQVRIRYKELGIPDYKKIITASTEELQQYLFKYGDNPKAYNAAFFYTCTRAINY